MKLLAAIMLVAITQAALADEGAKTGTPAPPCFEVVVLPPDNSAPAVALMVNKCTGDTWALNRLSTLDSSGKVSGFGYEWDPLSATKRPVP